MDYYWIPSWWSCNWF